MIVPRALWLFPSALAVDWKKDVMDYVSAEHPETLNGCPKQTDPETKKEFYECRRLYDPATKKYFAVPEGAFGPAQQLSLLNTNEFDSLYNEEHEHDDDGAFDMLCNSSSRCDAKGLEIIAQYMTAKYWLSQETKQREVSNEDVEKAVTLFEVAIEAAKAKLTVEDKEKAEKAFFSQKAVVNGDNKTLWGDQGDRLTYERLVDERRDAQIVADNAAFKVNLDEMRRLLSEAISLLAPQDFLGQCNQGVDVYELDGVISDNFDLCLSGLREFQSELSSVVARLGSSLQPPQKPLNRHPEHGLYANLGIFRNLEFFDWGQAEFGALLDLQKCVNFVHPASYEKDDTSDHLLDLITSKAAEVLPPLTLENLPQIRAMLNIGFDLSSVDWSAAVTNMSAADQKKPEAKYDWQTAETERFFTELYGKWAMQEALNRQDIALNRQQIAKKIIHDLAFPPKPIQAAPMQANPVPVVQKEEHKQQSDEQINSFV